MSHITQSLRRDLKALLASYPNEEHQTVATILTQFANDLLTAGAKVAAETKISIPTVKALTKVP